MSPHLQEACSNFDPFPNLPIELRFKIWKDAIDAVEPRIVEPRLRWHKEEMGTGTTMEESVVNEKEQLMLLYTSSCPIPALLHTSRESRELASARWKLCFAKDEHYPATIYFDHTFDILWLNGGASLTIRAFGEERLELAMVKNVAVKLYDEFSEEYLMDGPSLPIYIHNHFPCLATFIFIGDRIGSWSCWSYDRRTVRIEQRRLEKKMTIIHTYPGDLTRMGLVGERREIYDCHLRISKDFRRIWDEEKWGHVDIKYADYERFEPMNQLQPLNQPFQKDYEELSWESGDESYSTGDKDESSDGEDADEDENEEKDDDDNDDGEGYNEDVEDSG